MMSEDAKSRKSFGQWFLSMAGLATPRKLEGWSETLYASVAIFFSLLYLYTAGPAFLVRVPIQYQRGLYVLLISVMVFMKFSFREKSPRNRISWWDMVMIGASIVTFGYWVLNFNDLLDRIGDYHEYEFYLAAAAVLICLEVSRRVLGPMFSMVGVTVAWYSMYGNASWMPELLHSKGFSWTYLVSYCYSLEGIFGSILYTIATFVTLFVIFGGLMEKLGAGDFFIGFPYALTCGRRGGPAKTAVMASCLFGSISGSATANTAATGAFTIPLMIKTGYPREVAGAIEPAASTGGMFMPPVMGAGAFIMADMLQIPYVDLITVAFAPAVIYFLSVYMIVHFYAGAHHIPSIPKEERPSAWKIFKQGFYYFIPLALLIALLVSRISAQRAIYWTTLSMIGIVLIVRLIRKGDKPAAEVFKTFGRDVIQGFKGGGDGSLTIGAVAGTTGIVVAGIMLTGLGFSFTTAVMAFAQGYVILAIAMSFIAAYILGMGLTVTAAYILCAVLAAPSLVALGVAPIAAHFLLFWYSQTSNISPPVCLAAFVGSGIAKAHPYKCGFNSLMFSAFLLFMPLLFVYSDILMPDGLTFNAVITMIGAAIATVPYAAGITGYFYRHVNWPVRILLLATVLLFIIPEIWTTVLATAITIGVWAAQYLYEKKREQAFA